MQKITPCLWFDANCEEAMNFYTSLFPNSKIHSIKRYPENGEGPMAGMGGKVLTGIFELDGYAFQALDGGPYFKPNPSISFMVNFDPSQNANAAADIDVFWEKLSEGGVVRMPIGEYPFSKRFGWVEDKFGISWQLILTNPEGEKRPNIIPSFLFVGAAHGKAEEAAQFYISLFNNSAIGQVQKYPAGMEPEKEGTVMFEDFKLAGQWFVAMDSAREHNFAFNEAISLSIECEDQAEVDHFWNALSAHAESEQCGWVKDKYGVSWQIVPKRMGELLSDPDEKKSGKVLHAMLQMKKIVIADLEKAYNE